MSPEVAENLPTATSQSSVDIGMVALAVFAVFAFVFGLLMFRQVLQMTRVLPTPLSTLLRSAVIGYVIFAGLTALLITIHIW